MDLALVIDVLEHVPDPIQALAEIKRISKYAVFKVPLEDNLYSKIYNFLKKGRPRKSAINNLGHTNIYNSKKLVNQIEQNAGVILHVVYTNVYAYYLNNDLYKLKLPYIDKLLYFVAEKIYHFSPRVISALLTDFMVILVRCY